VDTIMIGPLMAGFVIVGAWMGCARAEETAPAAGTPATPASDAAKAAPAAGAAGECCKAGDTMPPLDLIKATPRGGLHNPYNDKVADLAEEGHKKHLSFGCNGCHGGGGGGGMCPPLTNDTWVYGADDDTLFRLIALGSDVLKKGGYNRVKQEVVVGPMPPFGSIIKTSDDLWKVITWIRSVNPNSVKFESTPSAKPN
jgi:mono/diheme cytochrome c family protein